MRIADNLGQPLDGLLGGEQVRRRQIPFFSMLRLPWPTYQFHDLELAAIS